MIGIVTLSIVFAVMIFEYGFSKSEDGETCSTDYGYLACAVVMTGMFLNLFLL